MRASKIWSNVLLFVSTILTQPVTGRNCSSSAMDYYTTHDGATYAYNFIPPQGGNATFLLVHGYPSSHKSWQHQISALTEAGYGTLAPDMLGFGHSDMPTEPEKYRAKRLAGHLVELLDHEGLGRVVGVSHDWGSAIISRFAVYHQDRLDKLIWVDTGYQPLGFLDIDAVNAAGRQAYGYEPFGYWYFMNRFNAGKVIRNHLESFWHLVYPVNHTIWRSDLAGLGAARAWLQAGTKTADATWIDQDHKADWFQWMSRPNATESGLNCYRSQLRGVNEADESGLIDDEKMLRVPVLVIGAKGDFIARPEGQIEGTRAYAVAGFESVVLDGGHWLSLERPDEVSKLLIEFGGR